MNSILLFPRKEILDVAAKGIPIADYYFLESITSSHNKVCDVKPPPGFPIPRYAVKESLYDSADYQWLTVLWEHLPNN